MHLTNFLLVAATALALGSTAVPTVHKRAHLRAPRDHIRYTNLNGTHANATEPALYFDGTINLCSHIAIAGNCVEMFITDPGTAGIPSCNVVDMYDSLPMPQFLLQDFRLTYISVQATQM
jgi:hypothetical protein